MDANPDPGHYEPGVIKVPSTEDIEKHFERFKGLLGGDEDKARRAVAALFTKAVGLATVIDEEERKQAVTNANGGDALYRQAVAINGHAVTRREQCQADYEKAVADLELFDTATHQDGDQKVQVGAGLTDEAGPQGDARSQRGSGTAPDRDNSAGGWLRSISRLEVSMSLTLYIAVIAASVVLGFFVDKAAFNALQLSQKTLGMSTTDGLAAAFAVLVAALGLLAGYVTWWALDPDAESPRKRRPMVLLGVALVTGAFLVTTIVTLREAYLHHARTPVPIWPLIGISLCVLCVDLMASVLRHNPWPAKRTELEDQVADTKEQLEEAEDAVLETQKNVMVAQANLATAFERLEDPLVVHVADKWAYIVAMMSAIDEGVSSAESLTLEDLIYPPQDVERLRWLEQYTASTPAPFAPQVIEGGLVQYEGNQKPKQREVDHTSSGPDGNESGASVSPIWGA